MRDDETGFSRRRAGKGFVYLDAQGKRITAESVQQRIRSLAIPPAWKDVWICKFANGHLQATGRDARGRKQYRYHPKWMDARNETKFNKLQLFGECLPKIRARVEEDLTRPGMSRDKVLAAVVRVMELTRIRVGNAEYAEENDSYGLTTIRNDHAKVKGSKVMFRFKGKSGIDHAVEFNDPRLSRIIQRCQDLPGEELFAYEDDDGEVCDVTSGDVNDYLRTITHEAVTAKDFRTWGGTVKAVEIIARMGPPEFPLISKRAKNKRTCGVIKEVAAHLRNTTAVCRKYYVHPAVFDADIDGFLHKAWKRRARMKLADSPYETNELVTLDILKRG